ncbi:serine threonine-protein kinase sbk1 [Lasius niger]|uniref:Serine threonine-protein kinase sbk1 n=1 Tax=Lasius niger TaxID=67767 RepID=A0A0J7KYZ5_LASNI|nr:serine threonine-protein kinase sbk1 [Lasius niger]
MSRNTKSHKNVQRRSALSFDGADDSLDHYIDHIVQSNPWKNVEEIEKSDAARIQNVLNEFDDMITQEKTSKAEPNVKEIAVNESVRKTNMKKVMSMTDINPLTSTPKKELPRTVGETAKDEKSIVKTRNPKMTDSENKSKKYVKRKEKKQETKTLEKNAKDIEHCQGEDDAKVSDKDNNLKIKKKSKNALEKNVENKPKEYVKRKEKKQRTKMLKKNAKDIKHCQGEDINIPNEIKNLESSKNKLQKSATSNKSPKPLKNNVENNCQCKSQSKSQCKKKGAENCGRYEQCLLRAKEQSEEKRKHSKSKKAAKAMGKLSHQISIVKKQMECIKNDLVTFNTMAEFNGASISHGKDQSNKIMLLSICYIRYVRRELI